MLLNPTSQGVPPFPELAAELGDQGVGDGLATFVGLEMTLGDVRRVLSPIDKYVIPGQVFWWERSSHQLVPLVGALEGRVSIEDHATVAELLVMYDLAHEELRRVFHGPSIAELDRTN